LKRTVRILIGVIVALVSVSVIYGMSVNAFQTGTGLLLMQEISRRGMSWDDFMTLPTPDRMAVVEYLKPRAIIYSATTTVSIFASLMTVVVTVARAFGLLTMGWIEAVALVLVGCVVASLGMGGAQLVLGGDPSLASGITLVSSLVALGISALIFVVCFAIRNVVGRFRRSAASV
jgi:hypothetical protein